MTSGRHLFGLIVLLGQYIFQFAYCLVLPQLLPLTTTQPASDVDQMSSALRCEYYEKSVCDNCSKYHDKSQCESCNVMVKTCEPSETYCYAYWKNDTNGQMSIVMKGCWMNNFECVSSEECIESSSNAGFCCCEDSFCNDNVYPVAADAHVATGKPLSSWTKIQHLTKPTGLPATVSDPYLVIRTIAVALVPLLLLALSIIFVFWLWRRGCSRRHSNELSNEELIASPGDKPSPVESFPSQIQLIEVKAHGRFGCVWKASMRPSAAAGGGHGMPVAVKIYALQDQQSWASELGFYSLERVRCHDNILRFIRSERRDAELWLVTEYHDRGSLYDHLKASTVSVSELIAIALSTCRGLAFMHSAVGNKPTVAHRDIKSRNILLRDNCTACLADFGLALVLDRHPGDVHGQVGTRLYMAPEVLDGSINFSIEHFLKIDVYACALVLWELMSRCKWSEDLPGEYQLPFESEVGTHPSLEDMQDVVVTRKQRPKMKECWSDSKILSDLCQTVEDSWDQDPEARLSAECIEERLCLLQQTLASNVLDKAAESSSDGDPNEDTSLVNAH